MSSQDVAPPTAPDDDDYSPEPTRHDRVMAELARRTELVAVEERAIAQAHARRAERLVELQDWSEDDDVAVELHGNPLPGPPAGTSAPMTVDQARAAVLPVGRFRDKARRLREKLHPESIATRNTNALAERRTYWEPATDGMAWLHWYGTADQTKAAFQRIDGMAGELQQIGEIGRASCRERV